VIEYSNLSSTANPEQRKSSSPVRRDSFLVFGSPDIHEAEIEEVVDTLRSGWLGTGPKTHRFEQQFRAYVGCKHALALNSCTAGIHLALDVLGIGAGDEVITTPITFASTANVIIHRGARPVFVDVDPTTMNIDPTEIEGAITPRTRAILPVHMAGRPCEMDEIMDIAERHALYVIEDAAHALEAWYRNQKIGAIGHITAFSFYATKNVCTGEGGMVTTQNDDWADEMRVKSLHGISKDAWKRYSAEGFQPYETVCPGYKYNMMDMQAALGIHQLARVDENLKTRERYSRVYDSAFAELPEVRVPSKELPPGSRHAHHLYTILLDLDRLHIGRDKFIEAMKAENIGTGIHFTALHLHKYYRERFGYRPGDYPQAEWVGERTVSLPLSPKLTRDDVADVIEAVKRTIARHRCR
jgi:dTDP-4-amino-4,6-dideoxygalactose transaminase